MSMYEFPVGIIECLFLLFMSTCVHIMVMLPAYVVSFTGACGVRCIHVE